MATCLTTLSQDRRKHTRNICFAYSGKTCKAGMSVLGKLLEAAKSGSGNRAFEGYDMGAGSNWRKNNTSDLYIIGYLRLLLDILDWTVQRSLFGARRKLCRTKHLVYLLRMSRNLRAC